MQRLWIDEVGSTSSYLKENIDLVAPGALVLARTQSAGRGQRGNSWEAEPGKNLTFSFWFEPEGVAPSAQFVISEAVALAMTNLLDEYGIETKVKWPNDIYAGDRKIAGILIENSIMGNRINQCVVGIGLNVNQTDFLSDAPNPVSMSMLTGLTYDLDEMAERAGDIMGRYTAELKEREKLHAEYLSRLWRGDGIHPYREAASTEIFRAAIEEVEASGHLILRDIEGRRRRYAFKEVSPIL